MGGEFFFATCFRKMIFFCAKNIFSSHLATIATGSTNPATIRQYFCTDLSHVFDFLLKKWLKCGFKAENSKKHTEICKFFAEKTERLFSDYCAQLWPKTSYIINASIRREAANCSIKSYLYRTTFSYDNLQLAEKNENDRKFASSKWRCDRLSSWKTVNMRRKKIALFSILAIKSNPEVVSKKGESAYFSNTIRRSENGPKIRRLTSYGGELTGMAQTQCQRIMLLKIDYHRKPVQAKSTTVWYATKKTHSKPVYRFYHTTLGHACRMRHSPWQTDEWIFPALNKSNLWNHKINFVKVDRTFGLIRNLLAKYIKW